MGETQAGTVYWIPLLVNSFQIDHPCPLSPVLPVSGLLAGFGLKNRKENGRQGNGRLWGISNPPCLC